MKRRGSIARPMVPVREEEEEEERRWSRARVMCCQMNAVNTSSVDINEQFVGRVDVASALRDDSDSDEKEKYSQVQAGGSASNKGDNGTGSGIHSMSPLANRGIACSLSTFPPAISYTLNSSPLHALSNSLMK